MLQGTVAVTNLPPNRGLIVNLCFFRVQGLDSRPPFGGDPPVDKATDCDEVLKDVDLNVEYQATTCDCPFALERSDGYYYVQARLILFRQVDGKNFAQAEQFFFATRPLVVSAAHAAPVTFPIRWPDTPIEEMRHYGTIKPRGRPWWRFWSR